MSGQHPVAGPLHALTLPPPAAFDVEPLTPQPSIEPAPTLLSVPESVRHCEIPSTQSALAIREAEAPCLNHVPSATTFGQRGAVVRERIEVSAEDGIPWITEPSELSFTLRFSRDGAATLDVRANHAGMVWSSADGPSATAFAVLTRAQEVYGPSEALTRARAAARPLGEGEIRWNAPEERYNEWDDEASGLVGIDGRVYRFDLRYGQLTVTDPISEREQFAWVDFDNDGQIGERFTPSRSTAEAAVVERIREALLREPFFSAASQFQHEALEAFPGSFAESFRVDVPVDLQIQIDNGSVLRAVGDDQSLSVSTIRMSAPAYGEPARVSLRTPTGLSFAVDFTDRLVVDTLRDAIATAPDSDAARALAGELDAALAPPVGIDTDGYSRARLAIDAGDWSERYPNYAALLNGAQWISAEEDGFRLGSARGTWMLPDDAVFEMSNSLLDALDPLLESNSPILQPLLSARLLRIAALAREAGAPVIDGDRIYIHQSHDFYDELTVYDLEARQRASVEVHAGSSMPYLYSYLYFNPVPRVEIVHALRNHLDGLIDVDRNPVELEPALWAPLVDGLPEYATEEPEDPYAATAWRAFNVDEAVFLEIRDLLTERHGLRPRRWLGWMNDSRERPVLEAATAASARFSDVDPSFLYTVAIGEGMNQLIEDNYNGSDGEFETNYINGFGSLGTDVFGMDVDLLRARGLLPEPFDEGVHYTLETNVNEKGEEVVSANFHSVPGGPTALENGLSALAAMLVNTQRGLLRLARELGHDVDRWTQSEINYISYVGYNAGYGTARSYLRTLNPGDSPLRRWVGDDPGGSSMRVHYNTAMRISTWEMLKSLGVWDRLEDTRFDVRNTVEPG